MKREPAKATCKLCMLERPLRHSHIVPEFIFRWGGLYNHDNKMMGINGVGSRGYKTLQKGLRDYLLCHDCEQFINDTYEKPFLKSWFKETSLPKSMRVGDLFVGKWDYPAFKLFHLSILYRAAVSSLPTCSLPRVDEDDLRNMLLTQDPGSATKYPILGCIVVNNRNEVERRIVTPPKAVRYEDHMVYGQMYGGVMWYISISYPNSDFSVSGLQPDGHMALIAEDWTNIPVLQDASRGLRGRAE